MYIKSIFKVEDDYKEDKEYKRFLKESVSFDLRRVSKLNLLAIYGAVNCLKNINYDKNLSIYTSTNNGNIEETYKVLNELKDANPIMPFDFLNINTNNTGFYISKAINSKGNNYTISSNELSFEKTLQTIFFEYKSNYANSFLIGYIDESLKNIPQSQLKNIQKDSLLLKDNSSWLYIDSVKDNCIAKLELVEYFQNLSDLNNFLNSIHFDMVALNKFAQNQIEDLNIRSSLVKNFENLSSISDIIDMLNSDFNNSIFISIDENNRAYLINFIK